MATTSQAITALPTGGKQLLTLEQVQEQFKPERWAGVNVQNDDGTETVVAFRGPKLVEYKRFMQEKDSPNVGEINAILNLIGSCCLTHDRNQINAIIDDNGIAFITLAGEAALSLTNVGLSATKKG